METPPPLSLDSQWTMAQVENLWSLSPSIAFDMCRTSSLDSTHDVAVNALFPELDSCEENEGTALVDDADYMLILHAGESPHSYSQVEVKEEPVDLVQQAMLEADLVGVGNDKPVRAVRLSKPRNAAKRAKRKPKAEAKKPKKMVVAKKSPVRVSRQRAKERHEAEKLRLAVLEKMYNRQRGRIPLHDCYQLQGLTDQAFEEAAMANYHVKHPQDNLAIDNRHNRRGKAADYEERQFRKKDQDRKASAKHRVL